MRTFFADTTPLRTRDFRRLWLAGIITVIGGNLTIFAVPVQLYALTQNSGYVGLSGLFALVPLIVFGLLGGPWADACCRCSRRSTRSTAPPVRGHSAHAARRAVGRGEFPQHDGHGRGRLQGVFTVVVAGGPRLADAVHGAAAAAVGTTVATAGGGGLVVVGVVVAALVVPAFVRYRVAEDDKV